MTHAIAVREPVQSFLSSPDVFLQLLREEWEKLHVDITKSLEKTWTPTTNVTNTAQEAVFDNNIDTDELFMAYGFARYLNTVEEAGKKEYSLPVYTNFNGMKIPPGAPVPPPGSPFPSGGALSEVLYAFPTKLPNFTWLIPFLETFGRFSRLPSISSQQTYTWATTRAHTQSTATETTHALSRSSDKTTTASVVSGVQSVHIRPLAPHPSELTH